MSKNSQQRLEEMTYTFDEDYDDSDGESNMNGEFYNAVLDQLFEAGLLARCDDHGPYATFRGQCPPCHYCRECEESPCVCDDEDACEVCGYVDCQCERCSSCANLIEECTCVGVAS